MRPVGLVASFVLVRVMEVEGPVVVVAVAAEVEVVMKVVAGLLLVMVSFLW